MQVKYIGKEGLGHKFYIKDTRNDILNAVRRTIMKHVPTYAVKEVSIYKNNSVMPDEMLAHRIGLVPIYADEIEDKEYHLYLKKNSGMVYSGDIEGQLEIPLKNIPLVNLTENLALELELLVTKGTGKEHVKYSPGNVYFYNLANIKQKAPISDISGLCPCNLLELKANKVFLKDPFACDVCRYCESKTNRALELEFNPDEFLFIMTSFGNLSLENIFKSASDYLLNELDELKSEFSEKTTKVKSTKSKK